MILEKVSIETSGQGGPVPVCGDSGFMITYSGQKFNPLKPNPSKLFVGDIAHALSNICRWGGHCNRFFSVAQHSVLVSYYCDFEDDLAGLMHDASEAFLSDIVRPVKYTDEMLPYREIESNLEECIARRYRFTYPLPISVKAADDLVMMAEASALFSPIPEWAATIINDRYKGAVPLINKFLSPAEAEREFLARFVEINRG